MIDKLNHFAKKVYALVNFLMNCSRVGHNNEEWPPLNWCTVRALTKFLMKPMMLSVKTES